jgi:hypothetical protein
MRTILASALALVLAGSAAPETKACSPGLLRAYFNLLNSQSMAYGMEEDFAFGGYGGMPMSYDMGGYDFGGYSYPFSSSFGYSNPFSFSYPFSFYNSPFRFRSFYGFPRFYGDFAFRGGFRRFPTSTFNVNVRESISVRERGGRRAFRGGGRRFRR